MADIFRDSPFGQILRLYFLREMSPFEDERPGFDLSMTIADHSSENGSEADADDSDGGEKGVSVEQSTRYTSSRNSTTSGGNNDIQIVTFIGPHDRDNPQNWSLKKKLLCFFHVCLLTFTIYSGSAIVSPAEKIFQKKYGVSEQISALTLSMYVLGYGLGPLLFSPLSEIPELGRNVSYVSSLALFIIVTAIAAWIDNFPAFIVLRLLQGFFGGPVLATGSASAQDLFAFHKVQYAVATWAVFVWAGPVGGPVASGFAISHGTWRWGMWETLMVAVVTFVLIFFSLPETNAEYILRQRARRIRVKTRDLRYKTEAEINASERQWSKLVTYHLMMPFKITILDPAMFFINLYTALMYSIYYSFFESFPIVFGEIYGYSVGISSLLYLAVLVGGFLGCGLYFYIVRTVYEPYTLKHGVGSAEYRLYPGTWAAFGQPIGMFIFGYASKPDISWPAPCVGIVLYAMSAFIVLNSIFSYLPLGYPRYAASAFAANGFLRSALAVGFIHFAFPMFEHVGIGDGCAILGSISALYALLYVILYRYAATLRERSKFAE